MKNQTVRPHLLDGRYALKSCLFASDLGYLYHAKDTQHSTPTTSGLPVLVHFFPSQAISNADIPATLKRLKTTITSLNHSILPVIDHGRHGNENYFVMTAPGSWSVKVLPELPRTPSNLHKTAMKISSSLRKSGDIKRGLAPQAFLVVPGGLRLLGTALMEQFQVIQSERSLLPPLPSHPKGGKKRILALLGLTMLTGALVAGGNNFYALKIQTLLTSPTKIEKKLVLPEPSPLSIQANTSSVLLDNPQMSNLALTNSGTYQLAQPNHNTAPPEKKSVIRKSSASPLQPNTLQPITTHQQTSVATTLSAGHLGSLHKFSNGTSSDSRIKETAPAAEDKIIVAKASKPKKFQFAKPPSGMKLPEGFCGLSNNASCKPETTKATVTEKLLPVPTATPAEDTAKKPLKKKFQFAKPPPGMSLPGDFCDLSNAGSCKPEKTQVKATKKLLPVPERSVDKPVKSERQLAKPQVATDKKIPAPIKIMEPRLTANGLNSEQLKNKAYAALSSGAIDEKPGSGCIFYIRLLKRIDAENPHIRRLARGVVSAYHTRARQNIKQHQQQKSTRLLWMAERVIKEFNLTDMNRAQSILKRRHSE